jgi:hypothetical protein
MERINAEQPVIHELKIEIGYLRRVQCGNKLFEIRNDDRNFQVNDMLMLREFDKKRDKYGNSWSLVKVLDVFGRGANEKKFLKDGFVILSIEEMEGVWNVNNE